MTDTKLTPLDAEAHKFADTKWPRDHPAWVGVAIGYAAGYRAKEAAAEPPECLDGQHRANCGCPERYFNEIRQGQHPSGAGFKAPNPGGSLPNSPGAEPPATLSADASIQLLALLHAWRKASSTGAASAELIAIDTWFAARLATARREGMEGAAKICDGMAQISSSLTQAEHYELCATAVRNAARTASTTGTVERPRDPVPLAHQYVYGLTIHTGRHPEYWMPLMEQCYINGFNEALKDNE